MNVYILTKKCRGCQIGEWKKGTPEYSAWLANHHCDINHHKSSGAMESAGAVEIFSRSIEKYKLVYYEYLGNGDTSSFKDVPKSEPYKEVGAQPVKLECIGKNGLAQDCATSYNMRKALDETLSGRGNLTRKTINSMQKFYGLAIRKNIGELYQMKKATGAHCCKTEKGDKYRHRFCPSGEGSECKFKKLSRTCEKYS